MADFDVKDDAVAGLSLGINQRSFSETYKLSSGTELLQSSINPGTQGLT
jgi:hypothetical protein